MKNKLFLFVALMAFLGQSLSAQRFLTKNGHIWFYSDAPLEKIEAHNKQVNAALDASTGEFIFKVLMKSFLFKKALMQEHFNENYVESDKYPNSSFAGKILNIKELDFSKNGIYEVTVEGKLTVHGVTKDIRGVGTLVVQNNKVYAKSRFFVKLVDYNIAIPKAVIKNIAETVEVNVDVVLELIK